MSGSAANGSRRRSVANRYSSPVRARTCFRATTTTAAIRRLQDRVAVDASAYEGAVLSHLRSALTYATRLSAGSVADEWFKKHSRMKLQMKREALHKLNRAANESPGVLGQAG
jgi:hypothetical protein